MGGMGGMGGVGGVGGGGMGVAYLYIAVLHGLSAHRCLLNGDV